MNKPSTIQDAATLSETFQALLHIAREAASNSAFRLLEIRGGKFCPGDQSLIELGTRDHLTRTHLPELLDLDELPLSILYGLAARAAMHRALEAQEDNRVFRMIAGASIYQEEA